MSITRIWSGFVLNTCSPTSHKINLKIDIITCSYIESKPIVLLNTITNEWKKLVEEVKDRIPPINKLMLSGSQEESLELRRHIMESKIERIDEVFNDQDFYLHKVHRKHQNHHQGNKTE